MLLRSTESPGAKQHIQVHDRAPIGYALASSNDQDLTARRNAPGCSWSVVGEDVHGPGTRRCRPGTPRAQGGASRRTVNKTYQVMRLPGNVATNSHDIKKCKPAKAALLPQPASGHAVSGSPGHERVSSAPRCTKTRRRSRRPQQGQPTKKAPEGAHQ